MSIVSDFSESDSEDILSSSDNSDTTSDSDGENRTSGKGRSAAIEAMRSNLQDSHESLERIRRTRLHFDSQLGSAQQQIGLDRQQLAMWTRENIQKTAEVISRLQSELDSTRKALQTMKNQKFLLQDVTQSLNSEIKLKEEALLHANELERRLETFGKKYEECQQILSVISEEKKAIGIKLADKEKELVQLQTVRQAERQSLLATQAEVYEHEKEVARESRARLEQTIIELERKVNENLDTWRAVKLEKRDQEARLVQEIINSNNAKNQSLAELSEKLKASDQTIELLQSQYSQLREKLAESQKLLEQKDLSYAELERKGQEQLSILRLEKEDLHRKLELSSKEFSTLETEKSEFKNNLIDLQRVKQELDLARKGDQARLRNLDAVVDDLKAKYTEREFQLLQIAAQRSALQAALDARENEDKQAHSKRREIELSMEDLKAELTKRQETIALLNTAKSNLQTELDRRKDELDQERLLRAQQARQYEAEKAELLDVQFKSQQVLKTLQQQFDMAQHDVKQLQIELEASRRLQTQTEFERKEIHAARSQLQKEFDVSDIVSQICILTALSIVRPYIMQAR
jgi:chromosome segregation ATPase